MYFILRNLENKRNFDVVFVPLKDKALNYIQTDITYETAVDMVDVLNAELLNTSK